LAVETFQQDLSLSLQFSGVSIATAHKESFWLAKKKLLNRTIWKRGSPGSANPCSPLRSEPQGPQQDHTQGRIPPALDWWPRHHWDSVIAPLSFASS